MSGYSRIPILADRIATYRRAVRSGAMLPDARLRYGVLMQALGAALLFGPPVARLLSPLVHETVREWHKVFAVLMIGGLALFYAGAYVVSLALDPRSVAKRSHKHQKQVT